MKYFLFEKPVPQVGNYSDMIGDLTNAGYVAMLDRNQTKALVIANVKKNKSIMPEHRCKYVDEFIESLIVEDAHRAEMALDWLYAIGVAPCFQRAFSLSMMVIVNNAYDNVVAILRITHEFYPDFPDEIFHSIYNENKVLDNKHKTPDTLSLAKVAKKDLTVIPILADALEESGFNDEVTLGFMRNRPDLHTNAMWALTQLRR